MLASRNENALDHLAKELSSRYGIEVHKIACDLSRADGVDTLWQWCKKNNLWPDILINNAGQGLFGRFEEQTARDIHHLLYLNIESLTFLCHRFGPKMIANHGIILNVSSLVGLIPTPYFSVYSATKSYVLSLSRSLYEEWHHRGVTVSCLLPGYMRTAFDTNAQVKDPRYLQLSHSIGLPPEKVAQYVIPRLLRRKPVIYASTTNRWIALFLGLIPLRLRSLIAKLFLQKYVTTL